MQPFTFPSPQPLRAGPVDVRRGPALESKAALLAWKEAEAMAWEAERCLYAAWYAYRSSGLSVPALVQHHATMARKLARQRLDEIIVASRAMGRDTPADAPAPDG